MYNTKKLKEYTIKGKHILKCRGMLFTEWCKLNEFDYMIDEVDINYLYENYGLTLDTLTQGFDKSIRWVCCNNSNHIMWFKPVHRTNGHWNCPYCTGTLLDLNVHSVKIELSNLLDEWAFDKNIELPENVSTGSTVKFWWKCRNCGEYFRQSAHKRKLGQSCPYCKNLKVKKGLNDLFTKRPDLEDEWDWDENFWIDPYSTPAGCDSKVNWICRNNPEHRWIATITSRANEGCNCPYCSCSISFPEKALAFYLSQFFTEVIRRYKLSGVEYDIYLPDEKLVIEFNGYHWHQGKEAYDNYKIGLARANNLYFVRIDAIRTKTNSFYSIKEDNNCLYHVECYCEKSKLSSMGKMIIDVCSKVLLRYTKDSNKYISCINCRKDLAKITIF